MTRSPFLFPSSIWLLFFLFSSVHLVAQKSEVKAKIANIKNDLKTLQDLDKLSNLHFELIPGEIAFNEQDPFSFATPIAEYSDTEVVDQLANLTINTQIYAPYTLIDIDSYNMQKKLGINQSNYDSESDVPSFVIDKIYYKDGTVADYTTVKVTDTLVLDSFDLRFNQSIVKSVKAIKAIDVDVSFAYQKFQKLSFDLNHRIQTMDGDSIKLIDMSANQAMFEFPSSVNDLIEHNWGVYKDGRLFNLKGSNYHSKPSKEALVYFKKLREVCEYVIKNERKFSTVAEIDQYIANAVEPYTPATENIALSTYFYSGPIASVVLHLKNKTANPLVFKAKYNEKKWSYNNVIEGDMVVFTDYTTGKKGIMNLNGVIVIPAKYEGLKSSLHFNLYDARLSDSDESALFWLDSAKKELKELEGVFIYRYEIYGDMVSVEKGVNGPKGLLNVITGQMVVEPIHNNVIFSNNYIIVVGREEDQSTHYSMRSFEPTSTSSSKRSTEKEQNYFIYDKKGKKIMSVYASTLKIEDDFFYVTYGFVEKRREQNVFDRTGKNITQRKYYSDETFSDGLLLVFTQTGDYTTNRFFFIDPTGNVVLTIDPNQFKNVKPFSEGLAMVTDVKSNSGFIDKTGKLVIPCLYSEAKDFQKGLSYVELNNKKVLIDKKGKTIVTFPANTRYPYFDKKLEQWVYDLYDESPRRLYDQNGNVMEQPSNR